MSEKAPNQPKLSPRTVAGKATRHDRLAEEMRKNLMKRKQQQRQKSEEREGASADDDKS